MSRALALLVLVSAACGAPRATVDAPMQAAASAADAGAPPALPEAPPPTPSIAWRSDEPLAVKEARMANKPLLVDFWASWCDPCKELDAEAFGDASVRTELAGWIALRIDATNEEDPTIVRLEKKYAVNGYPTVVLFDARGREKGRIEETVGPDELLAALRRVKR